MLNRNNTRFILQIPSSFSLHPSNRRIRTANTKKGILVFCFNNFCSSFPKVDSEHSQYTSLGSHDLYTTYKTDKIRSLF